MASAALKIEPGTEIPGETDEHIDEPQSRDFEAEAREHGWAPKDEWLARNPNADPARFVDAETFIKRADDVMPLLKATTARQKREIESLKKDLKRISVHMEGAEKRAYDRAMADLETKLAEATEAGDTKAVAGVAKEMRELAPVETPQQHTKEEAQEALDEFREEHPWYDKANLANASEVEINARLFYDRMLDKNIEKTKEMAPAEFFAYIAELTLDKYPALKGKPARIKPASAVEAGTAGPRRGMAQTWDNLPDDAKRQYTRFIDRGLLGVKASGDTAKDLESARKYYARSHDWKGYEA
jgi:hypothetical protein